MAVLLILIAIMAYIAMGSFGKNDLTNKQGIPDIGKRVYVLGEEGMSRIKVVGAKIYDGMSMKDPIIDDSIDGLEQPAMIESQEEGQKVETAKLNFRNKSILGRHSKPRWDFKLEPMLLERADDTVNIDVLGKVFKSNVLVEGE